MRLSVPFALSGVLFVSLACGEPPASSLDRTALRASWEAWVASRDSLFRSDASPFPDSAAYDGVPYFDYDSTLALEAVFVPALATDTIPFPTTSGQLQPMVRAGQLVFTADGTQHRLTAFQSVGQSRPRLFVPFRDETSGRTTYGGGRYLDLDLDPDGRYALDLNRAYHPYCVYDVAWVCPLPPPENSLGLAVTAGERLPDGYGS